MHYLILRHDYRSITYSPGEGRLICFRPKEKIRAWAYDQGIRYVLRRVQWDHPRGIGNAMWIGFYNEDDAFAFKMRWS